MVDKFMQRVIEVREWDKYAGLFIHDTDSRFLEQCQHRTRLIRQMLAACTISANCCQHLSKQAELVGNKRITSGKISSVCIQLLVCCIRRECDQVFDHCFFLIIEQPQRFCRRLIFLQYSLSDNFIYIRCRKRQSCIKASLNL